VKGTISRVLLNKGFVFIRDENGDSRFALARHFKPEEAFDRAFEGMFVEFTPIEDTGPSRKGNGLRAENVKQCSR
jgi:hypothetical protein